jgi:hypothetical protein
MELSVELFCVPQHITERKTTPDGKLERSGEWILSIL